MSLQPASLGAIVRDHLLNMYGIAKFSPNRRFASLYSEGSPSDSIYFLESGLIKIHRRGEEGKEIILQIISPGELFGEQALGMEQTRAVSAEVLQEGLIYVIPRDLFLNFCESHPEVWHHLAVLAINRKRDLERKIELLCLRDVEYRILYYLVDLASAIGQKTEAHEYSIPLSQGELASLIGAPRETTSTTLNTLSRRGLVRLGRRQLVVSSLESLRAAATERGSRAAKV